MADYVATKEVFQPGHDPPQPSLAILHGLAAFALIRECQEGQHQSSRWLWCCLVGSCHPRALTSPQYNFYSMVNKELGHVNVT